MIKDTSYFSTLDFLSYIHDIPHSLDIKKHFTEELKELIYKPGF